MGADSVNSRVHFKLRVIIMMLNNLVCLTIICDDIVDEFLNEVDGNGVSSWVILNAEMLI